MFEAATSTRIRHGTKRWLRARRDLVTASDVAAILGLDDYKSALEVYVDKTQPSNDAAGEAALWGNIFEWPIIKEWSRRVGRKVVRGGELLVSKEFPWLGATLDASEVARPAIIEAKTTGAASNWRDAEKADEDSPVPLKFVAQTQSQILVTRAVASTVVYLPLRERRLGWLEVEPHNDFHRLVVEETEAFMARVRERRPPSPDGSESSKRALLALYTQDNGERVALDAAWVERTDEWLAWKDEAARLKKQIEAFQQDLLAHIGAATYGDLPDRRTLSYKTQTRTTTCPHCQVSTTTDPFRKLYLHQPKPGGGRRG